MGAQPSGLAGRGEAAMSCTNPDMLCEFRGHQVVCGVCPTWSGTLPELPQRLQDKLLWGRATLLEEPVIGADPGQHMGLAVVQRGQVRWTEAVDWTKPTSSELLVGVLDRAQADGVELVALEVLGKTQGDARGRATSWAVMSRTAGRVQQEAERRGMRVLELDPGTWRSRLQLPRSFGEGAKKTLTVRRHCLELLGLEKVSTHVGEAALIALAGSMVRS